jgi:hypothetical protein
VPLFSDLGAARTARKWANALLRFSKGLELRFSWFRGSADRLTEDLTILLTLLPPCVAGGQEAMVACRLRAAAITVVTAVHGVLAFRTPLLGQQPRLHRRSSVRMDAVDYGSGPYRGPPSFPLLESVRYPHDMKRRRNR